ncbi:isocitrate lyase/PEP mutase family protein [Actinophytocola oryzae]|uniref:2-methylisocitrate lyase-like PEP mutase family enzyme n=1 Tax=Actinophytocola oryzae TaxID=502181 RepID=A0A4V3FU56_9PSEU|nr:isocitrate lyase/phosphoenolpyruvate mutase family protein [Actinophytocola oryzae]TDV53861.1 2-methylisocitrate lyase-like PEP mutase family enzyme [Actinophytocola oryzae]
MTVIEDFRRLHDEFLLLPNAWDVASGAALVREGFPAVGTTSLGVAAAVGVEDGSGAGRTPAVELARRLVALPVPVSVDVEGGFSEDPGAVRELGAELAAIGVAGVNIEDGLAAGGLREVAHHARLVEAMASTGLFVNARTDTYWSDIDRPGTGDRLRAYVDAGAEGVFVPGVAEDADVASVVASVAVPVNVLFLPGRTDLRKMRDLGVRRVSTGSFLFRVALGAALDAVRAVRRNDVSLGYDVPTYQQVQSLVG